MAAGAHGSATATVPGQQKTRRSAGFFIQ